MTNECLEKVFAKKRLRNNTRSTQETKIKEVKNIVNPKQTVDCVCASNNTRKTTRASKEKNLLNPNRVARTAKNSIGQLRFKITNTARRLPSYFSSWDSNTCREKLILRNCYTHLARAVWLGQKLAVRFGTIRPKNLHPILKAIKCSKPF